MIDGLFFPILVSAIITVALIGGLFKRASAWGLVDNPDTFRKTHLGSTPLIGGLAIFICVTVFQLAAPGYPLAITLALCALVIVGIVDDKNNLPALLKAPCNFWRQRLRVWRRGENRIAGLIAQRGGIAAWVVHHSSHDDLHCRHD